MTAPVCACAIAALLGCKRGVESGHAIDRASTAPAPARAVASGGAVRVGGWNIEWLGQPNRRSGVARGMERDPALMAAYIMAADVSVLTVQEISDTVANDGMLRNETLAEALRIMSAQTGGRWTHRLFPSRSDSNQLVGIAWDESRVRVEGAEDPWTIPGGAQRSEYGSTIWSRPPFALKFSAGEGLTDFVVVTIHHKSDYGGDFSAHREVEADALVAALADLEQRFTDEDIVIIGDTNCDAHDEPALMAYERAGLVDLNAEDRATFWRGAALDRALVAGDQPELSSAGFEVHYLAFAEAQGWDETDFKRALSDHMMVVTGVLVMQDDD